MDGSRDCRTEVGERQTYDITNMWNLKKNATNELINKTERDSQT